MRHGSCWHQKYNQEIDNFEPFLKIGSADKDQQHAFAFTMVRKKSTSVAIRRIFSSKSDHILVRIHFDGKKNELLILFFYATQDLKYTRTICEKLPVFFEEPLPPTIARL